MAGLAVEEAAAVEEAVLVVGTTATAAEETVTAKGKEVAVKAKVARRAAALG